MSKPIQTVEELDAVLHWRGKHAQAICERDALQVSLNAADERADHSARLAAIAVEDVVLLQKRVDVLEGLLLQTNELLYAIQGAPGEVPSSSIDAMRGEVFTALRIVDGDDEHDATKDLSCYFGLTYASWLTLPRVLMEAMPEKWKSSMATLLNQYDDAYPNQPSYGTTVRVTVDGKIVRTPEWLINYRHPDRAMINQVRGLSG